LKAFLGCDIGKVRKENQDSVCTVDFADGVLALVCDGMGGMQNGSMASGMAISAAKELFASKYQANMSAGEICELLRECATEANQVVFQEAMNSDPPLRMGTTLVGVFARENEACLINIGDSRAYLLGSEEEIRQLTTDHTVVQVLYEQGVITAEERATHYRRNELIRAVGVSNRVLSDTQILPLQTGDRLLLCSDGLYGMLPDQKIQELSRENSPEKMPEVFIREANEAGGRDNISVILLARAEETDTL